MRSMMWLAGTGLVLLPLIWACDEAPPGPSDGAVTSAAVPALSADGRSIAMLDQCEPESFNAAIGPGTCVRDGGITFDKFLGILAKQQTVPSWAFSPGVIHVPHEATLAIRNLGGEVHTFTRVEEFGGGFIPDLNELSGNPVPAPECLDFASLEFIPAGGEGAETFTPGESEKFMCCIHPWMRAVTN